MGGTVHLMIKCPQTSTTTRQYPLIFNMADEKWGKKQRKTEISALSVENVNQPSSGTIFLSLKFMTLYTFDVLAQDMVL